MKTVLAVTTAILLAGCATTLSEEECLAGNWAEIGYADGVNGKSSSRIAKYAEQCAEFGTGVDREIYLTNYDRGVQKYCTYETGYATGENGGSFNTVCSGALATDYAPGYDAGREIYEVYQGHRNLIAEYDDAIDELVGIRGRLSTEELSDKDRKRLLKKEIRLEDERDSLREEIRNYEYRYDLPRHSFVD